MSTKTTLKRVALVAVSALGFGLMSAVPSKAADAFTASFTAPSSFTTVLSSADSQAIGTVQINATASTIGQAIANDDVATVTITAAAATTAAQTAKNVAFRDLLQLSTYPGATNLNGATGFNTLNNSSVVANTALQATMFPASGTSYQSASGQAFLRLLNSTDYTAANGGQVTLTLTAASGGVLTTIPQTLTLTVLEGTRTLGTVATSPAATVTTRVEPGKSVTVTHTRPYTGIAANDSWTESVFVLGNPQGSSFSVTAAATGGSVVLTRDSATQVTATAVKNNIGSTSTANTDGNFSITYTVVINVSSAATTAVTLGRGLTAGGATTIFTANILTPTSVYASATAVPVPQGTGYWQATGDGILWASAVAGQVATVPVVQLDQLGAVINSQVTAKKTVTATITGRGSLTSVGTRDEAVKSSTWSLSNGGLVAGADTTVNVFSDGTSGAGTLVITVDGVTVRTLNMRFWGDAATVEATVLRPIGNGVTGDANGRAGANITTPSGNIPSGATIRTAGSCSTTALATPTNCTVTSIAVTVRDANGYPIPTGTVTAAISDPTVVQAVTQSFVDSGISDAANSVTSAGTFVRHYVWDPQVGTSGKTSTITFSTVNAAGTTVSAPAVTVALGGTVRSGTLKFDKATYQPGEQAVITATGLDAAGNKAADGEDMMAADFESTLSMTAPASFALVDGTRQRTVYAPSIGGTWTITATNASGDVFTATATVANPAAQAASAAEAATDAALEAIDAANAATDAANLAAEAADAATVAAEEARDAADAATAAVEALASEVATLMAALKAQITTLANTVAKIAKRVRA